MSPAAVAVDGGYIYWTEFDADRVMRAPVDGGDAEVVAANQERAEVIAARDGLVVWGGFRSLRMKDTKSAGPVVEITTEYSYFSAIVIEDQFIYWGVGNQDAEPGEIRRYPRAGGAIETIVQGHAPWNVLVRGDEVYWSSLEEVAKAPTKGGPVTKLYSDPAEVNAIALGDTDIYWATPHGVMAGPQAGGTPRVLAEAERSLVLVSDDKNVYWVNFTSGALMEVPAQGGAPTVLVPGPSGAFLLALDESWVYWVDQGAHQVKKVHK